MKGRLFMSTEKYDLVFIGLGAASIFAAYELQALKSNKSVCIIEKGKPLEKRVCPINGKTIKSCIHCDVCSIMSGAGGAGAFSDGKYNITTDFGGDIADYIGKEEAIKLMNYVDSINLSMGGEGTKKYSTTGSKIKTEALKYDLHMLDAEVRHLGTDRNYHILSRMIDIISKTCDIKYETEALEINHKDDSDGRKIWIVHAINKKKEPIDICCNNIIIATGRSGSKWTSKMCDSLGIKRKDNRVDIGVRFECHASIWEEITSQVYESKILYRSPKTGCTCRTFCMNQRGYVVNENTNGIVTVNGHSFEDPSKFSENTNFALLVTHVFTEPFKDSNAYGEAIANLTNMLAGGVMIQRFGDLISNRRSTPSRIERSFVRPTLSAEPGNLALAIPKLTLDTIIEMVYQLDKLVPGTANYDNLLYGTEVKFYNSKIELNDKFMTNIQGLYIIGDCSGTTHSLSQASAEGVYIARIIANNS